MWDKVNKIVNNFGLVCAIVFGICIGVPLVLAAAALWPVFTFVGICVILAVSIIYDNLNIYKIYN